MLNLGIRNDGCTLGKPRAVAGTVPQSMKRSPACSLVLATATALVLTLGGTVTPSGAAETASAPQPDGWSVTIRPYLWNASIKGAVDTGADRGGGGDFGGGYQFFTLENLDGVAMAAVEATRGPWRLHLDGLYISYEDRFETRGSRLQSTLSLDGAIVEVAVEHALPDLPFHVFGGARWQRLRTAFRVNDLELVEDDPSWTDPFLGLAYRAHWGKAWDLLARGDIGGFTLGSQFAYRVEGQLGYGFTSWLHGTLGYRHLDVDYRAAEYRLNLTMTGWLVGLGVTF